MLKIEKRSKYRSIGLIDDFVVFGTPDDYLSFAKTVRSVIENKEKEVLLTDSSICIEVEINKERKKLFTLLQNETNEYYSSSEWENRNILRIEGSKKTLIQLHVFLIDLSGRGEGYSYISEYSKKNKYSRYSPEWRLHVNVT